MNRRYFLFCSAIAAILSPSLAAKGQAYTQTEEEYFKAQALDWSRENNGIAIALTMSTESTYTAAFLGQKITKGFEQLNGEPVETKVFSRTREGMDGESVTFFLRGAAYGPFGLSSAAQAMPGIVKNWRAVQRV